METQPVLAWHWVLAPIQHDLAGLHCSPGSHHCLGNAKRKKRKRKKASKQEEEEEEEEEDDDEEEEDEEWRSKR